MADVNVSVSVARLEADRETVRAEMQAMESRIDAGLAQLREDIAKRETRMILAVLAIVGAAVAILKFL